MICGHTEDDVNILVVSEQGYGKRSSLEDYRVTNRGGKGVKTINITDKTGKLVSIKGVTDDNDLMIINKSGITIRISIANLRVMGRATQGVRIINLEKRNDKIASVCKVSKEEEVVIPEETTDETPLTDTETQSETESEEKNQN